MSATPVPLAHAEGTSFRAGVIATSWLAWSLLVLPPAWFASVLAMVLRARLAQGFWPNGRIGSPFDRIYDYPVDPTFMPIHSALIIFLMVVALGSLIVGPAAALVALANRELHRPVAWFAVYLLWAAGMPLLLIVDPGRFVLWIVD